MVTILYNKMPVKPIYTAHILHYVMQVWVLIPIPGMPLRIQEHPR